MRNKFTIFGAVLFSVIMISCQNSGKEQTIPVLVSDIITAEVQKQLTPNEVINDLKAGNQRYLNNELTSWDFKTQVRKTADGQFPKAIILSCVDSRVPVEYVFDQSVGDVFVARVAGNFVNEDILGSAEFACKVSGSKIFLVLGHESCGAVKAAIDDVKLGNITPMLTKIKPAVQMAEDFAGQKSTNSSKFVSHVVENNVKNTIDTIRENSPILKEMEDNGEIDIVGAVYSLSTGAVTFLD